MLMDFALLCCQSSSCFTFPATPRAQRTCSSSSLQYRHCCYASLWFWLDWEGALRLRIHYSTAVLCRACHILRKLCDLVVARRRACRPDHSVHIRIPARLHVQASASSSSCLGHVLLAELLGSWLGWGGAVCDTLAVQSSFSTLQHLLHHMGKGHVFVSSQTSWQQGIQAAHPVQRLTLPAECLNVQDVCGGVHQG